VEIIQLFHFIIDPSLCPDFAVVVGHDTQGNPFIEIPRANKYGRSIWTHLGFSYCLSRKRKDMEYYICRFKKNKTCPGLGKFCDTTKVFTPTSRHTCYVEDPFKAE